MTTSAAPATKITPGLRVLPGRRLHRVRVAPWALFSIGAIVAFFAIIGTRTALDQGAYTLADLNGAIGAQQGEFEHRRLEVARLQSPARIAPLAVEMGLVFPSVVKPLAVATPNTTSGVQDRWADLKPIVAAMP